MIDTVQDKKYSVTTIGDLVVSIQVRQMLTGAYADWWISSNYEGSLLLVGHYSCPVYGEDAQEALRSAEFLTSSVAELVKKTWNGFGYPLDQPDSIEDSVAHAKLHMKAHLNGLLEETLIHRTAQFVRLARLFGCKNSSAVVAEFESVDVRAVHERVQRYRRENS